MRTTTRLTHWLGLPLLALLALSLNPAPAYAGAKITIINADGPNEGFNDPTPVAPVGGNPGTTLGAQRLIAFQYAANLWGATLDSNVEIRVLASFDPLGANVLGSAGATWALNNFLGSPGFPGAEYPDTWYHSALADKRAGRDVLEDFDAPGEPDIRARFSSNFNFYLGLDNNHGPLNDLVAVVLHELAHGLGFANFVTETTGSQPDGLTDIFSKYALDASTNLLWSELTTDAERQAAALKVDQTVWTGAQVNAAVPATLVLGRPEVTFNAGLTGSYRLGLASFGPVLAAPGVSGDVVLAQDDTAPAADACTPLVNGAAVAGKIALLDRGICTFVVKVKNAQDAGAIAVLVADNVLADPPSGLGGVDPTITIPSARITLTLGNAIKAELAASVTVNATLGVDLSQRAGADPSDRAQLYATNPVQSGSSISHWDSIAFRNQLMEPAINPDLTHQLIPPVDMTLPQMRDIGWFPDSNLDGTADTTVVIGTCDSGVPNASPVGGTTLSDQINQCRAFALVHGNFVSCVAKVTIDARNAGLITGAAKGAIDRCAGLANPR